MTSVKRSSEVRRQEYQMMTNSGRWPWGYFLPMKKRIEGTTRYEGVLAAGQGPKVFLINMWEIPDQYTEALKDSPTEEYSSFAQLMDDGWMVD